MDSLHFITPINISLYKFSCSVISAPDPYALISCEGRKVRTPVQKDTLNPLWNTGALFYVRRPQKTRLVVQVSLLKSDENV